jgi:nucleoside 2-deoxyribosyltransferase
MEFLHAHGFIGGKTSQTTGGVYLHTAFITPRGHEQLEKIRASGTDSAIGFCAMWFKDELLPVWAQGIEPAIRDAGYDPQRIDRVHHNNKIDDEIVAMIRRSRFVVADFTGNRGGVYFEAGLAMGREIPVVWTIRRGRFHRVHFDNRQYNFVDWSFDALPDFKMRLQNRIEATLGRGPLIARH